MLQTVSRLLPELPLILMTAVTTHRDAPVDSRNSETQPPRLICLFLRSPVLDRKLSIPRGASKVSRSTHDLIQQCGLLPVSKTPS